MRHQIREVIALSCFGTQKFSARRSVKEQVSNPDGCAAGMRGVLDVTQTAAFDYHPSAGGDIFGPRHQLHARYRSN